MFKRIRIILLIPRRRWKGHAVSNAKSPSLDRNCADFLKGIVELFKHVDESFDQTRVCIKIPSTWEGLQACRILQSSGIATLATTLFTIVQVYLAGEVGCHYIAPYVNELKVHFEPGCVFLSDFLYRISHDIH
jgi:transaldolase